MKKIRTWLCGTCDQKTNRFAKACEHCGDAEGEVYTEGWKEVRE